METRSRPVQSGPNLATGRGETRAGEARRSNGRRAVNGLGWLSIGLGLAEVALPGYVAKTIGTRDTDRTRRTLVALGLREMMAGVGILAGKRRARWVWSRVAGDAIDLALLVSAFDSRRAQRRRLAAATGLVAGVTALDAAAAFGLTRKANVTDGRAVHVLKSVTVSRSLEDVYKFWRNFENLPRFMKHLDSVTTNGNRSTWRVKAPAGVTVEWEAEITEDVPNEHIAWRSCDGATIANWGSVRFRRAPGGRGTEIRVELEYAPPGGHVAATIAKLFGREPGQQVHADLRRFKQFMETGDIVVSDSSIHGGMHPARPSGQSMEHERIEPQPFVEVRR